MVCFLKYGYKTFVRNSWKFVKKGSKTLTRMIYLDTFWDPTLKKSYLPMTRDYWSFFLQLQLINQHEVLLTCILAHSAVYRDKPVPLGCQPTCCCQSWESAEKALFMTSEFLRTSKLQWTWYELVMCGIKYFFHVVSKQWSKGDIWQNWICDL